MEISVLSNVVTIKGNIKTVGDYQEIKKAVDAVVINNKNVVIKILDSISMTSSVIGYFNKLILKDGIAISMVVADKQLIELLDDLNLTKMFQVKKG